MDSIASKIESIKLKLAVKKEEDAAIRKQVNSALAAIFCVKTNNAGVICDYHIKNGNLILKAKNKTFANELFLKKNALLSAFSENKKVKQIIIR